MAALCPHCGAAMQFKEYGKWWWCPLCQSLRRKTVERAEDARVWRDAQARLARGAPSAG